jgi:DNA replication protein DnaC
MKERSGLGARFRDSTFDNFVVDLPGLKKLGKSQFRKEHLPVMRAVRDKVKEWADAFRSHLDTGLSLVMLGDVGTGKNHLSAAAVNHIIENFTQTCYATSITGVFLEIKDSYRDRSPISETQILDKLINVDLLVLDELGLHKGTDFEFEKINWIINERMNLLKPFIMLSNLSWQELTTMAGDRLADRIADCELIQFVWPSFRGKGQ